MNLDLGRGSFISIKKCAQGVSLYSDDGPDCDDCTIQILSRKQVIELIAMLLVNTCPAPTPEELDEAVVKLTFSNLGQD